MSSFQEDLDIAKESGKPFGISCDCSTNEKKVVYLTVSDLAQVEIDRQQDQQRQSSLEVRAYRDLQEYLFQWAALRQDAPQSVKDFMALPQSARSRRS